MNGVDLPAGILMHFDINTVTLKLLPQRGHREHREKMGEEFNSLTYTCAVPLCSL